MRHPLALSFVPCALALVGQIATHAMPSIPSDAGALPSARNCGPAVPSESGPGGLSSGEWGSIRAAHEAWKRGVVATPEGHAARNAAQQWRTSFDGRGFTITPDEGEWTWGLQLVRWGRPDAMSEIEGTAAGCAGGDRVEYDWDASLTEWYVNGASGLEHGFTVHRRPAGDGPLVLELSVRGGLEAAVHADGRGASFGTASGVVTLSYAGLAVFDAAGGAVPARLVSGDDALRIEIEERGASYPLTIDPITQQAYLKASNTDSDDRFGTSVSVSGDTVVVGAMMEDSNATGVNGDQTNNLADNSGAAYVFVRSAGVWSQQAYLKASNTGVNDRFGFSVSLSGDTVVIGAMDEASNATGVNGDQTNNLAASSGAAYVFVRNAGVWSQQAYLKASNTGATDWFGVSVSVSGETVVVGAMYEDSNATGVNGNQANNLAADSGAAYVFVRSAGVWSQQAYLKASNTDAGDVFGSSVSVSGDTVVVGAYNEGSHATGVNGDQTNNLASYSGAAYVFVRSAGIWSQQAYLKASNTEVSDFFGVSVSVSGATTVVGAMFEASNATGVNGDQTNNLAPSSGAAYVFVRSAGVWSQQAYLKASNTEAVDKFGSSVSVSGDTVVVGGASEDSNATGVNGDQTNNLVPSSGAAYVFVRSAGVWSQQAYLKASNTGQNDEFGMSVSVSGDTVVVGAGWEDSNATGVNGDQTNNLANGSGAAYVFILPPVAPPPVPYCSGDGSSTACPCGNASAPGSNSGCLNSVGSGGALISAGTASLGADTLVLSGSGMPNSSALYFQGTSRLNAGLGVAFGDGLRCAGGSILRLGAKANVAGASQYPAAGDLPISIRGIVTAPGTRDYQIWYRNAAAFCTSATYNLSNGWEVVWVL